MPKKWALFAGERYEEAGGWGDYHSTHYTKKEAVSRGQGLIGEKITECGFGEYDWWHVVDIEKREIVASGHE